MRLEVVWAPEHSELDGDIVHVDRAIGLDRDVLSDVNAPEGTVLTVGDAAYGKGAAGTGVALILEVAEHAVNDVASLIGIGYALRALITTVSKRRERPPVGASAETLAAIAAAKASDVVASPGDWYHARTTPLTTDGSAGTDIRDVWVSAFANEAQGRVYAVFSSSTTRYLGSAVVPTEWWFDGADGVVRTDDQLADAFRAWF
jgi:hypothetical protein